MTPQTTFVNGISPWRVNPTHCPRVAVIAPEPAPVVVIGRQTPMQDLVLDWLTEHPNASMREIYEALQCKHANVFKAMRKLLDTRRATRKAHVECDRFMYRYSATGRAS